MSLHPCPVPGCPKQIKPEYIMCREHWSQLPVPVRTRLYQLHAPGQFERPDLIKPGYAEAMKSALRIFDPPPLGAA